MFSDGGQRKTISSSYTRSGKSKPKRLSRNVLRISAVVACILMFSMVAGVFIIVSSTATTDNGTSGGVNFESKVPSSVINENPHQANAVGGSGVRGSTNAKNKKTNTITKAAVKKPDPVPLSRPIQKPKYGRTLSVDKLEILSHASPVNLEYEEAPSKRKEEHPHMGALDENDQPGYIHDETALRLNPPKAKGLTCGNTYDAHYKMLTQKVKVNTEGHELAEEQALTGDEDKRRAKIFCTVYTIEKNHDKLNSIRETWGPKCDGFMVASTKTDKSLNTVNLPHEGPEEYKNIWQKVRSIWSYVYDNYYEEYDWFHIGGDDLYLIVENLRLYLESEEIKMAAHGGKPDGVPNGMEKPLFLGRRFAEQGNMERIFNSGGSGYTLNKAALKTLVLSFETCFPHMQTFAEDVMVASCLRKNGIFPFETKDDTGAERYMPFQPGHHLNYRPPKVNPEKDWYVKYSINIKYGFDHCSEHSVAFHYIKPDFMKRIHAILYRYCNY